MRTIVFRANNYNHEARISEQKWPRSLVGPDHLVVEHASESYVIHIAPEGFVAYAIDEAI